LRGIVFDIKRFAVHDGPGIRTTVFLKGCHLHCPWCQNPEGIESRINLWYFENNCIRCGCCLATCPAGALSEGDEQAGQPHILIDADACTLCGECVRACPGRALAFDGAEMSTVQVVDAVMKDRVFYDVSGGGMTLSGGDPLCQHEFALEILRACKGEGIHTALDTALYGPWVVVEKFEPVVDLFLADMKIWDSHAHKAFTGCDNAQIKGNLERLVERGAEVIVRVPLVPGVTATEANIRAIARYVRNLDGDVPVDLINFNPLARAKYRRMMKPYRFETRDRPLDDDELTKCQAILEAEGVAVPGPEEFRPR